MESYTEWFKRQQDSKKKPHPVKPGKVKPPKKPDIPHPMPGKALDSFIKAVDNLEGDWKQLQAVVDKKAKEPKKPKKDDEKTKGKPFGIPKKPVDDEDEKEEKGDKVPDEEREQEPPDQEDQGDEELPKLARKPGVDIRGPRDVRRPVVRIS